VVVSEEFLEDGIPHVEMKFLTTQRLGLHWVPLRVNAEHLRAWRIFCAKKHCVLALWRVAYSEAQREFLPIHHHNVVNLAFFRTLKV
jgi:hypothetical protein